MAIAKRCLLQTGSTLDRSHACPKSFGEVCSDSKNGWFVMATKHPKCDDVAAAVTKHPFLDDIYHFLSI